MQKYFYPKTLSILNSLLGSYHLIQNKRIFQYVLASPKDGDLNTLRHIIRSENYQPTKIDKFLIRFLRSFCNGIITTGSDIRTKSKYYHITEKPDYKKHRDMDVYYHYGGKYDESISPPRKPYLIVSNKIDKDELMTEPFFKEKFAHKIVRTTKNLKNEINDLTFSQFLNENSIELAENQINTIQDAIDYMKNYKKFQKTLIESISANASKLYTEENSEIPIDFLILCVHSCRLDESSSGSVFPGYSSITVQVFFGFYAHEKIHQFNKLEKIEIIKQK